MCARMHFLLLRCSGYGVAPRLCKGCPNRVSKGIFSPIRRVLQCGILKTAHPVLECDVTGLLAWWGGQPGQVGNEAATAVFRQCRGSGSSPSIFSAVFLLYPQSNPQCASRYRAQHLCVCAPRLSLSIQRLREMPRAARYAPCAGRPPPFDSSERAGVADTISG
jgi:hypothetical protein